jgi:prepilin-type N-terminal cleavage/methylation domain-containing protein
MLFFDKHYKKTAGYTIMELVTVIAISSIVMLIAASMFTSFVKNRNLKEAAAALISDMKLAKQRAAAESIPYQIIIDKDNGCYTIRDCCDTDCSSFGCAYNATNNLSKYGSNVTFTNDQSAYDKVKFHSRGTCSNGHITLQNSKGSTIKIITSISGRIRSEQILKN